MSEVSTSEQLKEYSRDIDYIKQALKLWETVDFRYKSNLLYEFYFYKNKFNDALQDGIEDELLKKDLELVTQALETLIDSLGDKEVEEIYENRDRNAPKTTKIDKLKYDSATAKFNGEVRKQRTKIEGKSAFQIYMTKFIFSIVLMVIISYLLYSGSILSIAMYIARSLIGLQITASAVVTKTHVESLAKIVNFIMGLALMLLVMLRMLRGVIDLLYILFPFIRPVLSREEMKFNSEEAEESLIEEEKDKKEVTVIETEKPKDRLEMAEGLVDTIKLEYGEQSKVLSKLSSLSSKLVSSRYKNRYDSSSKIENYYNFLLKNQRRVD